MKLRIGYVSRNLTLAFVRPMLRTPLAAAVSAALLYGCASSSAKQSQEPAGPTTALAGLVGRQMLVLPAQFLSVTNAGGGWDIVPGGTTILPILDEEIADAFRKRGVKSNWTFGREIAEASRRTGGITGNPSELSAQGIRRVKPGDTPLPEPLASEIRGIVALTNARYVILPLEVNVDTRGGERKGAVRLLLIDSRTARVTWAEEVTAAPSRDPQVVSEALSPFGFRQLSRDIASKFADMVVAQ